jgi:phosphatidate cytidylyltransferase
MNHPATPTFVAPHPDLLTLLAGLGAVLIIASVVGYVLERRLSSNGANAAIENLNDRIRAWWVMVVAMAIALIAGKLGVVILFALCSFAALREFLTLTTTRRGDHWALAGAFFIVLPVQYWLIYADRYGIYSIFIPVYAFLAMPIVSALRGDTENYLVRISEVQWALMITVFCASHVPALLTLQIPGFEGRNVLLIAFLVLVVQGSDVLQYVWGKLLGRTKIAPKLSPSKTVEGFVGGAASATALGAALSWMTPFTPLQAAGLSLVIVLMGFFGGLVMSAIKRDRGVKDWGHMIAGHGGFIDRLDSVVFSAPIFFHLVRFWWSTV